MTVLIKLSCPCKQISSIVEEILVTHSKLSASQRHESRFDAPKLFLQVLFTMEMFSDLAVLAVCLRFLTDLFKDYVDLFAFSVDLVLLKLLVCKLLLIIVLNALFSSQYACRDYHFLHSKYPFFLFLFKIAILGRPAISSSECHLCLFR